MLNPQFVFLLLQKNKKYIYILQAERYLKRDHHTLSSNLCIFNTIISVVCFRVIYFMLNCNSNFILQLHINSVPLFLHFSALLESNAYVLAAFFPNFVVWSCITITNILFFVDVFVYNGMFGLAICQITHVSYWQIWPFVCWSL